MTWVKIDDQFPNHPKVLEAGPEAMWLYVCGLCYCGSYLTDGKIPKRALTRLADVKRPQACADRLVEVELWDEEPAHYVIRNYLDFQPSKERVESQREAARQRQEKFRRSHGARNGVTNSVGDGVSSLSPTRPDPTRSPVVDIRDDDQSSNGSAGSSSRDPDQPVWEAYAELVADDTEFSTTRAKFIAGVIPKVRRERSERLRALRAADPQAVTVQLARWLYEDVDPIAVASTVAEDLEPWEVA